MQPRVAKQFTIENVETLKVIADPLRLKILRTLRRPRAVKQIAAELDIPPTKLYYHVNQLEKHGRSLLKIRDFRLLWTGQAVSNFGDALTHLTLLLFINRVTGGSTQAIAWLLIALALPMATLGEDNASVWRLSWYLGRRLDLPQPPASSHRARRTGQPAGDGGNLNESCRPGSCE